MTHNSNKLCHYVLKVYAKRLTPTQLRQPWWYFGDEDGSNITTLTVPADGESPSITVTMDDLERPDWQR